MSSLINSIDKTINFNEKTIRIVGTCDNPLFVAIDICKILGLKNVTDTLRSLPEKWKQICDLENSEVTSTARRIQGLNCINEAGLYKLIMRSNKSIAQKFQEVVCEEILPSLRKTGEFKLQSIIDEKNKEIDEKNKEIDEKAKFYKKQIDIETIKTENLKAKYECFYYRKLYNEKFSIENCVYIIGFSEIPDRFKIGCTNNLNQRLQDYNTEMPYEPIVYCVKYISNHKLVEKVLHHTLRKFRIFNSKEWFKSDDKNILITEINNTVLFFENTDKKFEHIKDIQLENKEKCDNEEIEKCNNEEIEKCNNEEIDNIKESVNENKEVINTKKCPSCSIVLSVDKFAKNPKRSNGIDSYCKECNNENYKETKNAIKIHITTKSCSKCLESKNIEDFYNRIGSSDGKTSECKNCTMKMYENSKNRTDKIEVETKKCLTCNEIKDILNFGIKTNSKDGHASYCKTCINTKGKKTRQDNEQKCTLLSKKCNTCKEDLQIELFWNCKTNKKDGKDNKCIKCHKKK